MQLLNRIMSNKHTSGAAVFIFTLEFVVKLIQLWCPAWFAAHSAQLTETVNEIQKLAMGYGLLMGADSAKKQGDEPSASGTSPTKIVGMILFIACLCLVFSKL